MAAMAPNGGLRCIDGRNDGMELHAVIDFEQPDDIAFDELGLFGQREEVLPRRFRAVRREKSAGASLRARTAVGHED